MKEQVEELLSSISDIELKETVKEIIIYNETGLITTCVLLRDYAHKICIMSQGMLSVGDYTFCIRLLLMEVSKRWIKLL